MTKCPICATVPQLPYSHRLSIFQQRNVFVPRDRARARRRFHLVRVDAVPTPRTAQQYVTTFTNRRLSKNRLETQVVCQLGNIDLADGRDTVPLVLPTPGKPYLNKDVWFPGVTVVIVIWGVRYTRVTVITDFQSKRMELNWRTSKDVIYIIEGAVMISHWKQIYK